MTTTQRLHWFWLNCRRVHHGLRRHPLFTTKVALKRLVFFATRRFVGDTITSPITGERIFNIQSLINCWAMHCIKELGTEWEHSIREQAAPCVFDVGSNIGQFRSLVLSLNPGARVFTVDAWPEMAAYVPKENHFSCAVGSLPFGTATLNKAPGGLTASTVDGYYSAKQELVKASSLDSIWSSVGSPFVHLLKVDIDGAEFDALDGAREMLTQTKTVIVETGNIEQVKRLCPNRQWSTVNRFDFVGTRKD